MRGNYLNPDNHLSSYSAGLFFVALLQVPAFYVMQSDLTIAKRRILLNYPYACLLIESGQSREGSQFLPIIIEFYSSFYEDIVN